MYVSTCWWLLFDLAVHFWVAKTTSVKTVLLFNRTFHHCSHCFEHKYLPWMLRHPESPVVLALSWCHCLELVIISVRARGAFGRGARGVAPTL